MRHRIALSLLALLVGVSVQNGRASESDHDLVIYGGTSAAITAAVQAKRMGKSVVVVSPDRHLGGMSSSGLGWTDTGNKAVIGGLAREFYAKLYDHYQNEEAWQWQSRESYGNQGQGTPAIDGDRRTMWIFEPHVAEAAFESFVSEHGIRVDRDRWLDRESGVTKADGKIMSFRTLDGHVYRGDVFIDATYEGDLMAAAGVDYHVGRESTDQYDEKWNGVQIGVLHHEHHFGVLDRPVDPYVVPGDPDSGTIAKVSSEPPGVYGSADHRVQAYCYRLCMTNVPENRVPFAKPAGYDPADYELMGRIYEAGWRATLRKFDPIPNRKTDTNNHGPMSTDNIGANYDYPEASYQRRSEILEEHKAYQQGWLYFIRTDPRVPQSTRDQINRWGLAKDEFTDNENWPYQIYVREARRMIGETVMTENHLLKRIETPDPIGMGSYTMDSHNVQRYITPDGHVQNEGDIGVSTNGPYQIALGSILPKQDQCKNLLVPVCLSSSHIAFGSIRMEPVFMILGQSAATTACLAIDGDLAVQEVSYDALRTRLLADGQVLETPPGAERGQTTGRSIPTDSLQGIAVDNQQAKLTGFWKSSVASAKFIGENYVHDRDTRNGSLRAVFRIRVPKSGKYDIRLAYPPSGNRATNVPVTVTVGDQSTTVMVNQRKPPNIEPLMESLGMFDLMAEEEVTVLITNKDTDGHVIVDAVQVVRVEEESVQ